LYIFLLDRKLETSCQEVKRKGRSSKEARKKKREKGTIWPLNKGPRENIEEQKTQEKKDSKGRSKVDELNHNKFCACFPSHL